MRDDTKYRFDLSKKFEFWNIDHKNNFAKIARYYKYSYNYINDSKPLVFLEIGSCEGYTAVWLLDNILVGPQDRLICLEPDVSDLLIENLSHHGEKAFIKKEYSHKQLSVYKSRRNYFDFIYIDGDHNAAGVLEDMVLAWRILKPGGILLVDDYEMKVLDKWFYKSHYEFKNNPRLNWQHPSIAINSFLSIYRGCYESFIDNYQIGIKKVTEFGEKNYDCGDGLEGY